MTDNENYIKDMSEKKIVNVEVNMPFIIIQNILKVIYIKKF